MEQIPITVKDIDLFQKLLIIDSYLDDPTNTESIFSLIGWLEGEKNELICLELNHTISLLLERIIPVFKMEKQIFS